MARKLSHSLTGHGPTRQRGGTLLGLIIGALIGLGAALAVAVYITKVPVPFMSKGQSRSPDHDAAEARKNQNWNPNAPLYGKNPAKPAASGAVTDVTPQPPVAAEKPAAADPAKPAKPAADPIGDLAKAKMTAPTAPTAPATTPAPAVAAGADPFSYFVQVGAFRTPEDAEQQRAKISLMGLEAKVTEREQSGRTVFRVRLGPFDKKDDADRAKERLDGNGVETALVRVQR
ncbi:MAG: SPOR domain-containing protein [Polaromonas sp.]|nr:SPOR domain-containing protein [Polaromonas sp.]